MLTIKDLAVLQLANVAHLDTVTLLGGLALAFLLVINNDAADVARSLGSLLLCLWLGCVDLWGASGALLEVLSELNLLLVAAGGVVLLNLFSLLLWLSSANDSLAIVLLQLLSLLLAEIIVAVSLADHIIKAGLLFSSTLLALLAGFNKLGNLLLLITVNLGDSGVAHAIELVVL